MRRGRRNRLACAGVVLIAATMLLTGVSAAGGTIYVNTSGDTLSGALADTYALGAGGAAEKLGTGKAYAMTESGLQVVEDSIPATPEPTQSPEPTATVSPNTPGAPAAAPISGTVKIKNDTVRVGLYYRTQSYDTTREYVTLTNNAGKGFQLGYIDSSRDFHAITTISDTKINVLRDTNVSTSAGVVGCYHIKLNGSYSSYNDAYAVSSRYSDGFVGYYNGAYYAVVGVYQSKDAAAAAMSSRGLSGEAFSASNRCVVVSKAAGTQILFEYDCGTASHLAVHPVNGGSKITTSVTAGSTTNTYYGDLEFLRYSGGKLSVISTLDIEDYVKGVLPYEMSASWPVEALKAQALCARTYIAANFNSYGEYGFDVLNTAVSQVYMGTKQATANSDTAVDSTAGQYVTYGGALCSTVFSSSDGGATESAVNVWGYNHPYLIGKKDPYEAAISFPNKSWSYSYTGEELAAKLRNSGYSIGTVTGVTPVYTEVGNMLKLTFRDADGNTAELNKTRCYGALGLKSCHFTIQYNASTGKYDINGGGWGHNVGMSQWGAYSMASVYGYTYRQILGFYYTNITIAKGAY